MRAILVLCACVLARADVSHLSGHDDVTADVSHLSGHDDVTADASTPAPPPRPYVFAYQAGRFPGHADRQHTEVSDGSGVVRGSFSYVDPRQEVRTVDYVADERGFHPALSHAPPPHPADSAAVAREKMRHYALYSHIAQQHAAQPHPEESSPRQSAAVRAAAARHAELFRRIAEQHARIAAERELLQQTEREQELH